LHLAAVSRHSIIIPNIRLIKTAARMTMLDEQDEKLIAALRRDGRASLSELAGLLGLSRATVRARMDRLAARGEIAGFTVLTRGDVTAAPVRGLMMIGIEGRGADRIAARLAGMPAVQAVHSTNGKWDLIAEIGAETLEDLDAVLAGIRRLDGVATSETSLLLSTRRAGRR
jgi:DNA-binding Lrp family transcriptional regulator